MALVWAKMTGDAPAGVITDSELLKVTKDGVGVIGVSKGLDLALSMAMYIPQIKAAVCVNGSLGSLGGTITLQDGRVISELPFSLARLLVLREGIMNSYYTAEDVNDYKGSIIPVEELPKDTQVLWLVGLSDGNFPSEQHADMAVERRAKFLPESERNNLKVIKYPGAGHLLEPPYTPFCGVSYHRLSQSGLLWGGDPFEHCAAQEKSWQDIISFLRKNLTPPRSKL